MCKCTCKRDAEAPRELDRETPRHFIYRAHDEDGNVIYVGRSTNVRQRLLAHRSTLKARPGFPRADWLTDTRSLTMTGPFRYDEVLREERREIEIHQPRGNKHLTLANGHYPKYVSLDAARAAAGEVTQ